MIDCWLPGNAMDIAIPQYTKREVDKAGMKLVSTPDTIDAQTKNIISNWRTSHAYPLHTTQNVLRYQTRRIDKDGVVVQRLKRLTSIKSKLTRLPSMRLTQMQDIGGCRAILNNVNDVYSLVNELCKSENVKVIKDYIKDPKEDGYRGIHLERKYTTQEDLKSKLNGFKTEIQIRTKYQHAWATTVEIVSTFTGKNLKAGEKSNLWTDFFKSASYLFNEFDKKSNIELDQKIIDFHKDQIRKINGEININQTLKSFIVTVDILNEVISENRTRDGYLILSLDIKSRTLKGLVFSPIELDKAAQEYINLEISDPESDVVLLPVESIQDISKGYPNYSADSELFREILDKILKSN